MTPILCAIFLFGLSSLATAANFTQVFESNELDYEWPSEASRTQALEDGTFEPENIKPLNMAVNGTSIFLCLKKYNNIPATLVSLPTSSASSAPPKLTPFPSWHMHEYGNCDKIEEATGLEVDSVGRLWVLDSGSENCNAKLWIFNLSNNHTELIHRFPYQKLMHDLVLDETPNGTLAYIARWYQENFVVFSLERNKSWIVDTPRFKVLSFALSPNNEKEPRQLYLSKYNSKYLYSLSVATLRNGTLTANPQVIERWTAFNSYRMLMDNHGILYAAFLCRNYTSLWNTSQPAFVEQRFHEEPGLLIGRIGKGRPFTFALGQNGTIWIVVVDEGRQPKYRFLKVAVSENSYNFEDSRKRSSLRIPTTAKSHQLFTIIDIYFKVLSVVLLGLIMFRLLLKLKRQITLSQNTSEAQQMSIFRDAAPMEGQYKTVNDVQAITTPPSAILLIVNPRSAGKRKAKPRTFKKSEEAPRAPVENDGGPGQREPPCDDVAPAPSKSPCGEDATTSESAMSENLAMSTMYSDLGCNGE
ncbi:Hypothetical predicted protein [Cloeon dipterum]|uniref:Bee-milk protein n=1 Tax=Cloeon dipterum TaxID=197152 RepID=A0A8S1DBG8_9INSE|nr:Hypothetical predicted protein [Cloeon dipterum]